MCLHLFLPGQKQAFSPSGFSDDFHVAFSFQNPSAAAPTNTEDIPPPHSEEALNKSVKETEADERIGEMAVANEEEGFKRTEETGVPEAGTGMQTVSFC